MICIFFAWISLNLLYSQIIFRLSIKRYFRSKHSRYVHVNLRSHSLSNICVCAFIWTLSFFFLIYCSIFPHTQTRNNTSVTACYPSKSIVCGDNKKDIHYTHTKTPDPKPSCSYQTLLLLFLNVCSSVVRYFPLKSGFAVGVEGTLHTNIRKH